MLSSQFINSILTTPCIDTCKPFRDPYHFLKLNFDFRILTLTIRKLLLMKRETELIKLFSSTSHLYTQISAEFTPWRDYQCVAKTRKNTTQSNSLDYLITAFLLIQPRSSSPLVHCDKFLGIISNFRKRKKITSPVSFHPRRPRGS